MKDEYLMRLLEQVRSGEIETDEAYEELKYMPFKDMGFASVDITERSGQAFQRSCSARKDAGADKGHNERACRARRHIMGTRADHAAFAAVKEALPDAQYFETARIIAVREPKAENERGRNGRKEKKSVVVVRLGLQIYRWRRRRLSRLRSWAMRRTGYTMWGVAGIHRLFAKLDRIRAADVVIVVAGMEGALASVVGGLVDVPVIAVPTSIGYGSNLGGLSALLSMLNSCANGVGIVNIDNGFGAAYLASVINRGR